MFLRNNIFKLYVLTVSLTVLLVYNLNAATISSVTFEQLSAYKVPRELLLFNTQLRKGADFNQTTLDDDIKRLYATGFFSDVVAETRKQPDNTLSVIFKLKAKNRIKEIIFKGNKKFNEENLLEHVSLQRETPLNDEKLQMSAGKLRKFYRSEGYNEATVTPVIENADEQGYVNVVFNINEHLRLKVDDVKFVGNTVYSNWKLKRSINTEHSYFSWLFDIGLFDKRELERDKIRLKDLYWNKGFLDFRITQVDVVEDKEDPEYVDVTFHIDEGKPYKVGKIFISDAVKFSDKEILNKISFLKKGQTYDNRVVGECVDVIDEMYYPLGYADVSCKATRRPNYETHTVDVDFQIISGQVYKVRDINISGNKVTKDYVIRRELAIQPGDLLDNHRVKVSKNRLMGLDYFKQVDAVSVNTDDAGYKDVDINVKEKDTMKFNIGAGWSDTDSLSGVIGFEQSNFDISDPYNYFQGGGQRLTIQGLLGLKEWGGFIGFTEPWLFGIPLRLDVTGYNRNRTYRDWKENRLGTELSLSKKLFDDFTSVGVGYRFEGVRVYNMDDDLSEHFTKWKGTDTIGALSVTFNRDTRDNFIEPTSGYQMNLMSELSSQALGGSHDYYRFEAKGMQYFSLLDKAIVVQMGAKVGTVQMINNGGQAPLYERYFLGGGDSLRGFPFRKVGPEDRNEDVYGGDSMLLLTAEVSHPIWNFPWGIQLRGAAFVDAGGAFEEAWRYSVDDINVGVGYGLRVKIPQISHPIRLDLAYPIVNNQDGVKNRFRFHFNIGFNW